MTGTSAFSRDSDLTGLWSGEYWYGAGAPVPFSAHIVDNLGTITGTTLEPNTFAHPGLIELSADISGTRGELSVRFNKLYHPAPGVHRDPIVYSGTVDSQFTMIDGDWRFQNGFSGRFVLVRVSRGAAAVEDKSAVVLETRY
ncbi:MAG: hypothetical protein EON61_00315 [Alphaproteobacteria bacterium]|nr:MAG: hypothetical protein EON61_00315 [Alphaproteobacteria bacterium]